MNRLCSDGGDLMCGRANSGMPWPAVDRLLSKGLSRLVVAGGVACLVLDPAAADQPDTGPVRLTAAQMDGVTAGAAGMTIAGSGTASGDLAAAGPTPTGRAIDTRKTNVATGPEIGRASCRERVCPYG